ncbi:hypothetical protein ABIE24_003504 [Mycetocola sp. 2940]
MSAAVPSRQARIPVVLPRSIRENVLDRFLTMPTG